MARVLFGLLILLKIILYSKYESRHKRRHGGCKAALLRRPTVRHEAVVQGSLSGVLPRDIHLASRQGIPSISMACAHSDPMLRSYTAALGHMPRYSRRRQRSHMLPYSGGQATSLFGALCCLAEFRLT